ncbi:ATP-dependent Clp protease adaptor ClpS [Crocinitomix catalasitica]|uniref:ATP-dependent Clp protease adaptor ClpS n=1 Tax=Crocinitomix catalasitica TaxID=184607 RepID=UPI0004899D91|nr:ATP-dependent Clp protease adaptor ClpS [Crocinitomix catalasitica]
MSTEVEFDEKVALLEKEVDSKNLVVYNDDVNTFDHVIDSLVKVCRHEIIQAEQCTWIVHYNGKCAVKEGDMDKLLPMRRALNERGIDAKIH